MKITVSTAEVRSIIAAKHSVCDSEVEITTDGALSVSAEEVLTKFISALNGPTNPSVNIIALIKAYRTVTGHGLYESKIAVETALGRR